MMLKKRPHAFKVTDQEFICYLILSIKSIIMYTLAQSGGDCTMGMHDRNSPYKLLEEPKT